VSVEILAIGKNIGHKVVVRIGNSTQTIILKESLNTYLLNFDVKEPVNQIFFEGYVLDIDVDSRGLGIGISTFKISRQPTLYAKLIQWVRRRHKESRTLVAKEYGLDTTSKISHSEFPALELNGQIYLMELRAIDLMFDNWIEVLKVYSLAFENQENVNLLIVCPSRIVKFLFPFATQFFNQMEPRSTLIHFVFVDDPSVILDSLQTYEYIKLVRRADGKEYDSKVEQQKRKWVTIGPAHGKTGNSDFGRVTYPVRINRQVRQMLYGEFLPVVLTSDYDNELLLQAFVESSQFQLINSARHEYDQNLFVTSQNEGIHNFMDLFEEEKA
jgi:hypothetical protein